MAGYPPTAGERWVREFQQRLRALRTVSALRGKRINPDAACRLDDHVLAFAARNPEHSMAGQELARAELEKRLGAVEAAALIDSAIDGLAGASWLTASALDDGDRQFFGRIGQAEHLTGRMLTWIGPPVFVLWVLNTFSAGCGINSSRRFPNRLSRGCFGRPWRWDWCLSPSRCLDAHARASSCFGDSIMRKSNGVYRVFRAGTYARSVPCLLCRTSISGTRHAALSSPIS